MVTGYDHLLFLVGVVFYLSSFRSILIYVSLFSLGHSLTLVFGVLAGLDVSPYIVDAIIGFSVIYKGFDNLKGFQTIFGVEPPNEKAAIMVFGLFHGLGLATKLQDLGLRPDGLLENLLSFNLGVEAGQISALIAIVLALRLLPSKDKHGSLGNTVNVGLMIGGASLMFYQIFSLVSS